MQFQRRLHQLLAPLFLILLLSGACLYYEYLRIKLSDLSFLIRRAHILAGVGFSLAFVANIPYCWRARQGASSGPNHWSFLLVLFAVSLIWAFTGLNLVAIPYLGWSGPEMNSFQQVHVWVTVVGIWVVLPHLFHATRRRPKQEPLTATVKKMVPDR